MLILILISTAIKLNMFEKSNRQLRNYDINFIYLTNTF